MCSTRLVSEQGFVIERKRLVLEPPKECSNREQEMIHPQWPGATNTVKAPAPYTALVINASQEMAKEITLQLALDMPECSIMYAPTIELARWIIKRRKIELVVSSPVLPDGGIEKLIDTLSNLSDAPDLVVVGALSAYSAEKMNDKGYAFATMRQMGKRRLSLVPKKESTTPAPVPPKPDTIKTLGADIRNDLNNPLQEIVAMVFVAQASGEVANQTTQALSAIDKAAKNMSKYVNRLENKIREAVADTGTF